MTLHALAQRVRAERAAGGRWLAVDVWLLEVLIQKANGGDDANN